MTTPPSEADYFANDDTVYAAAARLRRTTRPVKRGKLFIGLGNEDWRRAKMHTAVFGPEPDEGGAPPEEWMSDAARLLWIFAEAELLRGHVGGYWTPWMDGRDIELRTAVDHLLDEYIQGGRRRPLVRAMCGAWRPHVCGQAIETAWCLGLRMPWWADRVTPGWGGTGS